MPTTSNDSISRKSKSYEAVLRHLCVGGIGSMSTWFTRAIFFILIPCILMLTACSTVTVKKQTAVQAINKQRGNIVTQDRLSTQTVSALLAYGIDEDACLTQFAICIKQLQEATLLEPKQKVLALFAEIHFAKAKQIADATICQTTLQRPPLDPNFANAPVSESVLQEREAIKKSCHNNYLSQLLSALRYSYAYLFYKPLTVNKIQQDSAEANLNILTSEVALQTEDIYNVATSELVKILYNGRGNDFSDYDIDSLNINNFDNIVSKASEFKKSSASDDSLSIGHITNSTNINLAKQINLMQLSIADAKNKSVQDEMTTAGTTTLNVYVPDEIEYINNIVQQDNTSDSLYSSYDLTFSGLNSISKREGVGVSYVTLLNDRHKTSVKDLISLPKTIADRSGNTANDTVDKKPENRIYRTGNLLLSGLVTPQGNDVDTILDSRQFDVNLYDPYHVNEVEILGQQYSLAANFSASYGLWLSENQLDGVGYLNLLSRQESMQLPQLFMLEPYDPNKRVIIMMHGLGSSPTAWVSITNDIFNDAVLRDNYQVWQVFYPTNIPILENRYQIQKLINTAYNELDPMNQHAASQHSVLIGHSMGAVIARMMLSNDNLALELDRLSEQSQNIRLDKLIRQSFNESDISTRLRLNKIDNIDRAVFISAPFRGTDFADRWFTRALRRIIKLPLEFMQTVSSNLTGLASAEELSRNPLSTLYLQDGASQLSDKSSFIKLTKNLKISDEVVYHSIIANQDPDIVRGIAELESSEVKIDLSKQYYASDSPIKTTTIEDIAISEFSLNDTNEANELPNGAIAIIDVKEDIDPALTQDLSDGVVPYTSAHLDGAASETIITGNHSIQETPQAVLVLRKVLREQLEAFPIESNNQPTPKATFDLKSEVTQ